MSGVRFLGIYAIIPTIVLLTISFFVLVVVNNVKEKVLKSFGNVIAMLLWTAAAVVLATGIFVMSTGYCPLLKMMKKCGMGMSKKQYKMMHSGMHRKGMMQK